MPDLTKLADDMLLRGQELPTEEEFEDASVRAHGIFGVPREPVRSARATHATAEAVRQRVRELLPAAESLAAELGRHAAHARARRLPAAPGHHPDHHPAARRADCRRRPDRDPACPRVRRVAQGERDLPGSPGQRRVAGDRAAGQELDRSGRAVGAGRHRQRPGGRARSWTCCARPHAATSTRWRWPLRSARLTRPPSTLIMSRSKGPGGDSGGDGGSDKRTRPGASTPGEFRR